MTHVIRFSINCSRDSEDREETKEVRPGVNDFEAEAIRAFLAYFLRSQESPKASPFAFLGFV